jgi:hypothetical protein
MRHDRVEQTRLTRPRLAADKHVPLDQRHANRVAELIDPDMHRVEDRQDRTQRHRLVIRCGGDQDR